MERTMTDAERTYTWTRRSKKHKKTYMDALKKLYGAYYANAKEGEGGSVVERGSRTDLARNVVDETED